MIPDDTAQIVLSRGAWLLACAGVPVGGLSPGMSRVNPDRPEPDELGTVAIETWSTPQPTDTPVTARVVALRAADLDELRAAALAEVARVALVRRSEHATISGVLHHSDDRSREEWVYVGLGTASTVLLSMLAQAGDVDAQAELAALTSEGAIGEPVVYTSADGQVQTLTTAAAVLGRYLRLLHVGVTRRDAALAAAVAVGSAQTVDDLAAALQAYL